MEACWDKALFCRLLKHTFCHFIQSSKSFCMFLWTVFKKKIDQTFPAQCPLDGFNDMPAIMDWSQSTSMLTEQTPSADKYCYFHVKKMNFFMFLVCFHFNSVCFSAVYETKQKKWAHNEGTTHIYNLEGCPACILLLRSPQQTTKTI